MPEVLRECDAAEEMQGSHKKEKWEVFAERKREVKRGTLKARVELLQQNIAKGQVDKRELRAKINVYEEGPQKVAAEKRLDEAKVTVKTNKASLKTQSAAYARIVENTKWTDAEKTAAQTEAEAAGEDSAQVSSWEQVLKKILGKVLKVEEAEDNDSSESDDDDDDDEAKTALRQMCMSRLREGACGLATDLKANLHLKVSNFNQTTNFKYQLLPNLAFAPKRTLEVRDRSGIGF